MFDPTAQILELLKRSDDESSEDFVFEVIGKNDPDAIFAFPQEAGHLVEAGKQWFERKSEEIRRGFCPQFQKSELQNVVSRELVTLVFTYLGSRYGQAMAAYLSVLVIKRLVAGWCERV